MGVKSEFPMRVKAFLESETPFLQRGDIVLSRSPTLSSWAIRAATGGYFSHAALVFLVPQPDDGLNNAFLLESTSAGVGLANLQTYVGGRHPGADIAVLRFEEPGVDERYFKSVCGLMWASSESWIVVQFWISIGLITPCEGQAGVHARSDPTHAQALYQMGATTIHLLRIHPVWVRGSNETRGDFCRTGLVQGWSVGR
jgi:hypothetical protein